MRLQIDAIADFVCPWCYLGKKRLGLALKSVGGVDAPRVLWHPFRLNPDLPSEGMSADEYFDKRYGGRKLIQPFLDELTTVGEKEGIQFRFDQLAWVPNTLNAHRLIQIVGPGEKQDALVDRLFSGFFEHGLDIGSMPVLSELAKTANVSEADLSLFEDMSSGLAKVEAEEKNLRKIGVVGVPNYILNGRYSISGAQEPGELIQVFDRILFDDRSDAENLRRIH